MQVGTLHHLLKDKSLCTNTWSGSEFPREKEFNANSRLHFTSESHGLASHSSETRCSPQSRLCFIPLELPGAFSLKCFCPLSAFAFTPFVFLEVLIQCSLFECPSWSTGSDYYRVTSWLEHCLAPYPDR